MHKGATFKGIGILIIDNLVLFMLIFQQMAVLCFEEETLETIHQEASKGWTRMALIGVALDDTHLPRPTHTQGSSSQLFIYKILF